MSYTRKNKISPEEALWITKWWKLLSLLLIFGFLPLSLADTSTTAIPTDISKYEDPGTCEWDLTSKSCDAYCCWDSDWASRKSTWESDDLCRNKAEDVALPFNDWVSSSKIKSYNREKGEYSYAGPLTRLFCIVFNNHPPSDTFYDEKTAVSNDEAEVLERNDVTFGTKLFIDEANAENDYYSIGDPLYAKISTQDSAKNFRLPKPTFSGAWNFDAPALYLTNEDVSCMGELTVSTDGCISPNFNPSYYSGDNLELLPDPQSTSNGINVTLDNYFTITVADGSYSETTRTNPLVPLTPPVSTFGSTSCTNIVKEAIYTITYNARDDGYLIPNAAKVTLVLYDSVSTNAAGNTVAVPMRFRTFFELEGNNSEIVYRSGNSGYLDLQPVLIGKVDPSVTGPIVNKDGFMAIISGTVCESTPSNPKLTTLGNNVLLFNQNMSVSWYIQASGNSITEFESLCDISNTDLPNLAIFDQLNDVDQVGKYGNADLSNTLDWFNFIEQDLTYTLSYNSTEESCTLLSEVAVEFLTSKRGYADNQHSYIISARKRGIERKIFYKDFKASNQKISLKTSFSFVRVTEKEASTDSEVTKVAYEWPSDILWPFGNFDSAYSLEIASVLITSIFMILE